tara:strand:- start:254 stop:448 length:195 start_codon:yes stop_codon:yes gene_type:complete
LINPWSEEARKRARKKWRKSPKGRAWDKAYSQRPEVKARRHEEYIKRLIKQAHEDNNTRTTGDR